MIIPANIAIEDSLSEAVVRRLLSYASTHERSYHVGVAYRQGGFGYLRRTINGWNSAARGIPIVVLTDLDTKPCASSLIQEWFETPIHHNLLFRVAVREVEAWLLGDQANLGTQLLVRGAADLMNADEVPDPKQAIVNLARRSKSSRIRKGMTPREGSTAKQGPLYNDILEAFVRLSWNIDTARLHSSSLDRALIRFENFSPSW
jgi:hypothetical protein